MNSKRKMTMYAGAMVLATMVGCKSLEEVAQGKKHTAPEGVTLMTESELRETLVGNTYSGDSTRSPGNTYVEFIRPDGTTSGLWSGTDRYKGKWAISGKVWCSQYKQSSSCNTLSKDGDTIYWYQLDGTTKGGMSKVRPGNPDELG